VVTLPGDVVARCNPIDATAHCKAALENNSGN
jgi:hypothetical protein